MELHDDDDHHHHDTHQGLSLLGGKNANTRWLQNSLRYLTYVNLVLRP